jgi:Ca2+-binding EF-hand superfamily protein
MSSAIQEGAPNLDKELSEYTTTQIENAITKAIFDVLDLDGDGTINPKELRVGFRLFGLGQPIFNTPGFSAKVDEIFQSMDVNKDGKITFKEFSESLRNEGILSFGTTKSGGNVSGKRA